MPVINSAMTGRVKIERASTTPAKWNQAIGAYEGGVPELLYLGRANIDRIARPTRREFVADAADNQMTQLMLPFEGNEAVPAPEDLRWQSNDMVTILATDSEGNDMIVGEKLFVRGWFGATEDWAYVLHCGFNSKQGGE
jgi:hypothetical protein